MHRSLSRFLIEEDDILIVERSSFWYFSEGAFAYWSIHTHYTFIDVFCDEVCTIKEVITISVSRFECFSVFLFVFSNKSGDAISVFDSQKLCKDCDLIFSWC